MVKEQSYQNTSRLPGFEELNEYFSRKWRLSLLTLSCVTSKIVWNSIQISPLYVIVPMLKNIFILINVSVGIWCDFDRASLLICGNKMPTRCNRGFYYRSYCLLNMFRAPLCPSSGAQEYCTVVAACGIWCCGFQVVGLVCNSLKTTSPNSTGSNHCIILLEVLIVGIVVPETCWASNKICNKKTLMHLVGILFPHISNKICRKK